MEMVRSHQILDILADSIHHICRHAKYRMLEKREESMLFGLRNCKDGDLLRRDRL